MEKQVIVLMGPPGSGKGTQAAKLSEKLGIPHISTGDILRQNIKAGTELGKKAKKTMDTGNLVADDLIFDMLFDRLEQDDCKRGYILDGVPRRISQAETLEDYWGERAKPKVVNLDVPDEEIVRRISNRVVCKDCGNVQHLIFSPPENKGECDRCGGPLVQREDDKEDAVKVRLKAYREETAPLVEYYRKKDNLVEIDGTKPPENVFTALLGAIGYTPLTSL